MTAEDARLARRTPHSYSPTGQHMHHASPLCGPCGLPQGNKVHDDGQADGWTSTGWGAQHRIRSVDGDYIAFVCHSADQRVPASHVDADADESVRCSRCAVIPGIGPMPAPTFGEVRRSPDGVVVACLRLWDGRLPASPGDLSWRVLDAAGSQMTGPLDSYDVVAWPVAGSIDALTDAEATR